MRFTNECIRVCGFGLMCFGLHVWAQPVTVDDAIESAKKKKSQPAIAKAEPLPVALLPPFHSPLSNPAQNQPKLWSIKGINGDKRPAEHAVLSEAVAQRSDITLINEYFTREETSTLISMANTYVSLHRSEGLGLTISEAMTLGVPVIATGYSGNYGFHAHRELSVGSWYSNTGGRWCRGVFAHCFVDGTRHLSSCAIYEVCVRE